MYDWDLLVAPGPPGADLERGLLEEWLRNPFLDDDVTDLCLRLGASTRAVTGALEALCATGLLRRAGSGYALALDPGGTTPTPGATMAGPATVPPAVEAAPAAAPEASLSDGAAVELAALSGAVSADPDTIDDAEDEAAGQDLLQLLSEDRGDELTREIEQTLAELLPEGFDEEELVEALPFGLLVLTPMGTRELANRRAADMLGLAPQQLDGATFELLTGVNPLAAVDREGPLSFSLVEPAPLEVTLQGRQLAAGAVILILLRDVSLFEEVSQIQAEVQQELFERLEADMVEPLAWIERFLEDPDAEGLLNARIAMEQINWFLQEFFLRSPGSDPERS